MFRWPLFRRDRYNSVISWPSDAVANHVLCTLAPRRENGTTLLRVRVQAAVGSPMLSAFRIQKISFQALVSIGRWVWCLRDSSRERGCSRSVRGNGDRCVCVWVWVCARGWFERERVWSSSSLACENCRVRSVRASDYIVSPLGS